MEHKCGRGLATGAQFKAKTTASHNARQGKISLSQAGTNVLAWGYTPMVRLRQADLCEPVCFRYVRSAGWVKEFSSSGVVMVSEDSNVGGEARDCEETLSDPLSTPQVSGRMKHLLFGVRLSAGLAVLPPASDLEQLASHLDAMRTTRMIKLRARSRCSR